MCAWRVIFILCFALSVPAVRSASNFWMYPYFEAEVNRIERETLADIRSAEDWNARKPVLRAQLFEMLGLDPVPEKTDLKPVITGRVERKDFVVENLHFQSMPGLYVTGNFYLPRERNGALPTILYVCGHGPVVKNGVSYGNKVAYQHHAAWFARNGYACLVIDTVQLGEIAGIHHGTYREKMWWWNSMGYSSAAVEGWNCIRALDYLTTRPEVDASRFGVTGRSGGGAYSWWVAALDERIKVAAPVAGITDLRNHVLDSVVEGHCDCMYLVNTYQWDYATVAALVAPRPLLIVNTDKDSIFPLDGVVRTHAKVAPIYQALDATNNLGLVITEGGHKDTQDLQVPVFRWFNRFFKNDPGPVEMVATPFFEPEELKVFAELPKDSINKRIAETFTKTNRVVKESELKTVLADKVFRGWPDKIVPLEYLGTVIEGRGALGHTLTYGKFTSQEQVRLPVYVLRAREAKETALVVLDQGSWPGFAAMLQRGFDFAEGDKGKTQEVAPWIKEIIKEDRSVVFLAPRGVGPTAMPDNERQQTHLRRRFMLVGQTLDSMRVWDIRRGLALLSELPIAKTELSINASGEMAVNAMYAALYEKPSATLRLKDIPQSQLEGPDYLNLLRFADLPGIQKIVGGESKILE